MKNPLPLNQRLLTDGMETGNTINKPYFWEILKDGARKNRANDSERLTFEAAARSILDGNLPAYGNIEVRIITERVMCGQCSSAGGNLVTFIKRETGASVTVKKAINGSKK